MCPPKSFQEKGRRSRVPLPFALPALLAAIVVALAVGRETRKIFFFEKASTISLHPQVLDTTSWETAISDLDASLYDSSLDMTHVGTFVTAIRQRPILLFFRPHIFVSVVDTLLLLRLLL